VSLAADNYVRQVEVALRDLPWRQRRELVAGIEQHLSELPAEANLHALLGPPLQYAAELRAAAGLARLRGPIAFLRARRPRNLVLTAIALVLVGLAIGAVVWIDTYQPLAFDMGTANPAGVKEAPAGDSESVVFRAGKPFEFGLDVENSGPFTVRLVGSDVSSDLFRARLFRSPLMSANGPGFPSPLTAFRPFDLAPGQAVALVLKGVYRARDCSNWNDGGSTSLTDFPVRYSFLWRTATAEIPLPQELAIVVPKGGACS